MNAKMMTGEEPFTFNGADTPYTLADFWSWSYSNILNNVLRGALAEFVVGSALGMKVGEVRENWAPYDLLTPDGIKVEVKSSAYLQGWEQEKPSAINFDIKPRADGTRPADVYIFCLFAERDRLRASPLDLNQWKFYVLATRVLDEQGKAGQMALSSLLKLNPEPADFDTLYAAVHRTVGK